MSALVILLSLLPPGLRPWPTPDKETLAIVKEARDGNRAGVAAVKTIVCRRDLSWPDAPKGGFLVQVFSPITWDYWLDGDTVRVKGAVAMETRDVVQHDGREMVLFVGHGRFASHVVVDRVYGPPLGDVRRECVFDFDRDRALSALLSSPHEIWVARRAVEDGVDSLYVKLGLPDGRVEVWLDLKHNYLVWKATRSGREKVEEYRVNEFQFSKDGACLPIRIENRRVEPDSALTAVDVLSNVRLNDRVLPESFRIPGLAGLKCDDKIRGVVYKLDENGEPAGPWEEPPKEKQDDDEPSDMKFPWWIFIVLGCLPALGLIVWVFISRRRRRT